MQTFIEPVARSHAFELFQWLDNDIGSREFIARSVPPCADCTELLDQLLTAVRNGGFHAWVLRIASGEIIAYAELKKTDKVSTHELELIYVVAKDWRNKSAGTTLIRKLLASEVQGLCDVIVAYINPDNHASRQVLIKNQFTEAPGTVEGIRYVYEVKSRQ